MKILGIGTHPALPTFLKKQYGLIGQKRESSLSTFEYENKRYVGGIKGFYSILPESTLLETEDLIFKERTIYLNTHISVSTTQEQCGGGRVHFLLRLKGNESYEERILNYNKKTRNQTRQSYRKSLEIIVGHRTSDFLELYNLSMYRLGSVPRSQDWFDSLENSFGEDIVCLSIFENSKLIGAQYGIRNQNYFLLLFNISLEIYWSERINNRLYDELIAWGGCNGIHWLDFGPGMERDVSHNQFKEGFGARRYYLIDDFGLWTKPQIIRKVRKVQSLNWFLEKLKIFRVLYSQYKDV